MTTAAPPAQIDALTGLRGIAAWLVVFYHARLTLTAWVPGPLIDFAALGYLAVDLFFMLSGFVMWLNYAPRLRAGGLAQAPLFWWRRFARIWPLHGAILLGLVGFVALLTVTGRDTSGYPLGELPLHVLLVQNWGFTSDLSWNHPAWSISTEMAAYALFPFAVLALRWERLSAPVLVLLAAGLASALLGVFALAGESDLGADIPRLGVVRCLAEFAIGMVLANLFALWRGHERKPIVLTLAGAALLGVACSGTLQPLLVPLGFAALLLALALDRGPLARVLGGGVPLWLGEISYATYLVHFPLFICAKLLLVGDDLQLGPAGFAGYCAVLLALSAGLYRWLEKPAQRWLNWRYPGKRPQVAA